MPMMIAADPDTLSLLAALIPLAGVLALLVVPLVAVLDAISRRPSRRPGPAPVVESVDDGPDELLAA
jgi:hypothetical protein